MTVVLDDSIFDCTFHGAAFASYVELAITTGAVPDSEATRRLAYQYYEELLAERNRGK